MRTVVGESSAASRRAWAMAGLAVGILVASPRCYGQAANGGIYNGMAHEPNPSVVLPEERRAGVAPDAAQQQNRTTVDRLGNRLLREEQTNPPGQPAPLPPRL